MSEEIEVIEIKTEFIKLDQLLKWANFVAVGTEAKMFIINGEVKVNGEVEVRRGKKIYSGDIVEFNGEKITVNIGEDMNDPIFTITDLLPHLAQDQMKKKLADGIGEK